MNDMRITNGILTYYTWIENDPSAIFICFFLQYFLHIVSFIVFNP